MAGGKKVNPNDGQGAIKTVIASILLLLHIEVVTARLLDQRVIDALLIWGSPSVADTTRNHMDKNANNLPRVLVQQLKLIKDMCDFVG